MLDELLTGKDWPRVQVKINGKLLSYENGVIELSNFKTEIATLMGRIPSNYELIQILTIIDKNGRVSGFPSGVDSNAAKILLAEGSTPPLANPDDRETVMLTFDNGKIVSNYQSQLSNVGYFYCSEQGKLATYTLRSEKRDPETDVPKFSNLYKMRRFYTATLQLSTAIPSNSDDLIESIDLVKSTQEFNFSPLSTKE